MKSDETALLNRPLGRFEQTWALMDDFVPVLFVGVLHLTDAPRADVLRRALDILQHRHPLLRVAIKKSGGEPRFVEADDPPPIPLTIVARNSPEHWRTIAEDELNTAIDTATPPLLRCTLVEGDGEAEFIFTFHHTIIDSRAGMMMVHHLLTIAAELEAGNDPAPDYPPLEALPAMEDRYPARCSGWRRAPRLLAYVARQMATEAAYRLRLKGRQQLHANATPRCRIAGFELPPDRTKALVRQARKRRMPLNSLLHAAMVKSVADNLYGGESVPMRGIAFADMRPYLAPPPAAEEFGVCISMLPYTVDMAPETDIWSLAAHVGDGIYRATKHDDKFMAPLLAKQLVQTLIARRSMRLGMVALSYVGPVKLEQSYGRATVRCLSGFVSNNVLGPELAAFGSLLHGRLKMDFLYLETDMDERKARKVVGDVETILLSAARDTERNAR